MKVWQYILLGLGVLFILIQFVPNELPAIQEDNPGDLLGTGLVDGEVATLMKTICYNCHSNTTQYPWYSYVAPVSWLIAKDVRIAREEVNFSNWTSYDMMEQLGILDDIYLEVDERHMPLPIYITMHPEADIDAAQRERIIVWAENTMDIIAEEFDEEEEEEILEEEVEQE